jgi:hypothetical protein
MSKTYVKFNTLRKFDALFDRHMRGSDDVLPPDVIENDDARMIVAQGNGRTVIASLEKDSPEAVPSLSSDERANALADKVTSVVIGLIKESKTDDESKFMWNVMKTTFPAVEHGRKLGEDVSKGAIRLSVGWLVDGKAGKATPKKKAKGKKKSV